MKIKRNKPITKQLSEKFGGKWRHIPFHGMWVCDELNLHANYVYCGGYDVNGDSMEDSVSKLFFSSLYVYGLKDGVIEFYPNI